MAESITSKANRYARGEFTNRELKIMLGGMLADQVIDIATFGRLSKLKGKAFVKVVLPIVRKAGLATARAAPSATARLAGTAIGATRFVVMRHPYVAAAVITYEAIKHREQIAQLAREGWEVVQDIREARQDHIAANPDQYVDLPGIGPIRPITGVLMPGKRKKSAYNRAVSAGMKALKRSNKMGARGKFTNSKRAFALVSKTASRMRKGAKVGAKGATGVIARSIRSILKRKK